MKYSSNNDSIENLINIAMDKIKTVVDSSTVIGEKVETSDGVTIIPISKISVGYVVGGGEYADLSSRRVANHFPMAGGSSGGLTLSPVGFLIINKGDVKFINVENKSLYQTILNMFNTLLNKIDENNQQESNQDYEESSEEVKYHNVFDAEEDDDL